MAGEKTFIFSTRFLQVFEDARVITRTFRVVSKRTQSHSVNSNQHTDNFMQFIQLTSFQSLEFNQQFKTSLELAKRMLRKTKAIKLSTNLETALKRCFCRPL